MNVYTGIGNRQEMARQIMRVMLVMAVGIFALTPAAFGQTGNGGGNGANNGTNNGTNNGANNGGTINDPNGGVEIDVNGVFRSSSAFDGSGQLDRQRFAAAKSQLNKDIQKPSQLRKVSLNRLEAEIAKLTAAGQSIPPEMNYMAGLTRVTHVFYFPDSKDIVLAGPAEGFFVNSANRVIGMQSGLSVLQLQDLVVALRAFGPDGKPTAVISCSIDPTPQGLESMKQAYAYAQRNFQRGDEAAVVEYFRKALGMQKISLKGVSPRTHFAQVMVDADYHMKLIGIGLERPPVRITSFIEKAKASTVAKNSLQRWYFQPNYDCVRISPDQQAMALEGGGVELVGEDERITTGGNRAGTGSMNRASTSFCRSFTKMYEALSEREPLYAELRNLIDLSVAAAFIQEMDFYGQADWKMQVFGNEQRFPVEKFEAPTQVAPAINAVWKGNIFMTPIGGGVNIQPRAALESDRMKVDDSGKIDETKKEISVDGLAEGQWWWD